MNFINSINWDLNPTISMKQNIQSCGRRMELMDCACDNKREIHGEIV
jgi:hypothetical protein